MLTNSFQQLPKGKYNGLTIVMSNPSRFDMKEGKLFCGYAGLEFYNKYMQGIILQNSHIRLAEMAGQLLPDTRVVLLLGQRSLDEFCKARKELIGFDTTLKQQRGSPIVDVATGIIYIASYLPQDAFDFKADYEKNNNEYIAEQTNTGDGEEEQEASEDGEKSTKGATQRKNFRFWLEKDCQKTIGLLSGRLTICKETRGVEIYPEAETVIGELRKHKNEDFYFDIETDRNKHITCFGFSFNSGITYCVPLFRHDYSPAYSCVPEILVSLGIAFVNNTVVGHNISGFDLYVCCWIYKLPAPRRVYDTMLAHHRLFPEVEKSLGHCISYYTTLPYHKGEGVFEPRNYQDEQSLWHYNAKDVIALKYVKAGQDKESAKLYAQKSIAQVNRSVVPYLTMTLTGIKFSRERLNFIMSDNDRRLNAILKIIKWMCGMEVLPSSPKQCVNYFHDLMGFKPVGVSSTTQKPSLNEINMLKLYIKEEHPVLPLCIYFRGLQKESGMLKFVPWTEEPLKLDNQQPTINV